MKGWVETMRTKPSVCKRYVVKIPVQFAARLEALFEMHPKKSQNQIICDVVEMGLTELDFQATGNTPVPIESGSDKRQAIYLVEGPFAEFHKLVLKHHYALEQELDKAGVEPQPPRDPFQLEGTD